MSAPSKPAGMSVTVTPPVPTNASRASDASAGSFSGSPRYTTVTSKKDSRKRRATTNASPPLFPGPARTSTPPLRPAVIADARSKAAAPARSIKGASRAAASILRNASVRYTGASMFGSAILRL